ncbi:hypothetical protein [Planctomicrobium sp. SH527]|uniref:hypothetical protein n=1 Tax=Planctomicrobium sp. SH527 TaxID=3448123 RepID=UPI003F5BE706
MNEPISSSNYEQFSPEEIASFDADDAHAGAAIGKMLTVFFLYTVVAMVGSSVATWYWIVNSTVR